MTDIGGRYTLGDLLGAGSMGEVFRATDAQTGDTVAIKALRADLTNPGQIERFVREGAILRELNHPNIVAAWETIEDNERHYIVMDYVAGGSLADALRSGPLALERVLSIALDVADALTRAHRLDVAHRDIKPANVLLESSGVARLADFGIAHLTGQTHITGEGMLIGTPRYLSPEAVNGQRVDARADIWAFGVMLFEMLAGRCPFEANLLTESIVAILQQPVPDLETLRPDTPVPLIDLVYRMLEKDSAARMPSVRIAGAELEAFLRIDDAIMIELGTHVQRNIVDGCAGYTTHPFGFERNCAVKRPCENRRDGGHPVPDVRRFHPHPRATM